MSASPNDRERKEVEEYNPEAFEKAKNTMDFTKGTGEAISGLPGWVTGNRGKEATALEDALEPLHRLVLAVPGKKGERREALANFKGFDPAWAEKAQTRIKTWDKTKLRNVVMALGIRAIKVSQQLAALQDEVFQFFNKPTLPEKKKRAPPAAEPKEKTKKAEKSDELPKTRAKKEKPATNTDASGPMSEDALRVEVYKRVLAMSIKEYSSLSVSSLRQQIEEAHNLAEGALKSMKTVVTEVAQVTIRSVMSAVETYTKEKEQPAVSTEEEQKTENAADETAAVENTEDVSAQ